MSTKDYSKTDPSSGAAVVAPPPTGTAPAPDLPTALAALAKVLENLQLQQRIGASPAFADEAKNAVGAFTGIVAALQLKFLPLAPSLEAKPISSTEIHIAWTDPTNIAEGYNLKRCEGPNCTNLSEIASLKGDLRSFTDAGRAPNISYSYQLVAFNFRGETPSGIVTATTNAK